MCVFSVSLSLSALCCVYQLGGILYIAMLIPLMATALVCLPFCTAMGMFVWNTLCCCCRSSRAIGRGGLRRGAVGMDGSRYAQRLKRVRGLLPVPLPTRAYAPAPTTSPAATPEAVPQASPVV